MIRTVILLAVLAFLSPPAKSAAATAEQVRYVMGTTATVKAWAPDGLLAEAAVAAAYSAFARVDSLMSTWRDDSVLNRMNATEAGTWVAVGPDVCRVLAEAKVVAENSGGAFDPTVLPLVRLWGFRGGSGAVPDSLALVETLRAVGHVYLEVDETESRARFRRNGMAVDLGGIAKGYALDLAAEAMRRAGALGGTIDLGGNILAYGEGPARRVGILDPTDTDRLAAAVPLVDAAAATSGQYERFLTIAGRKYGHILDPRTGWPVADLLSVTVVAASAMQADALATAAVVLGPRDGLAMIEAVFGAEAVIATADGAGGCDLQTTSGLVSVLESP